jgi:hypothetical protein
MLPQVVAITQVVSNAIAAMKYVREVSDTSDDLELKSRISDLYNALLDIRQSSLDLDEENRALRLALAEKSKYRGPIPPHGYYFQEGDQDNPLCPICFQSTPQRIAFLTVREKYTIGMGRKCKLCNHVMFE